MKTLILNGSPRINGDTANLIKKVTSSLKGDYKIINAYWSDISPCIDCRYCQENNGCKINDKMQDIYDYLQDCDNVIIASPIYFSELTGRLLDLCSRFQTYFCARYFRKTEPDLKIKKGAVILVGGGDGNPQKAYETAYTILQQINCKNIYPPVVSHSTNTTPAIKDTAVMSEIKNIVDFFIC